MRIKTSKNDLHSLKNCCLKCYSYQMLEKNLFIFHLLFILEHKIFSLFIFNYYWIVYVDLANGKINLDKKIVITFLL